MNGMSAIARRAAERARLSPGGARAAGGAAPPPPAGRAYLASRLGAAATLALIETHGGTRIHIPKAVNQGSRLARLLGLSGARALVAWRGGEDVKIPLARHWRVRIYRAEGDSYGTIARKLGITERAVHAHLQAARLTDQRDLFA
jgi:hypothetical protein